jgi:oligoribonuclease
MKKINKRYLAWIDLEMTGLEVEFRHIIECALIITDQHLNICDEINIVVYQPDKNLEMDKWCNFVHNKNGLINRVKKSNVSLEEAEQIILNFLKKYFERKEAIICGNCINQDRKFLYKYMPQLEDFFSHIVLDLSSFRVIQEIWRPYEENISSQYRKNSQHNALLDLKDNIKELKQYRYLWSL